MQKVEHSVYRISKETFDKIYDLIPISITNCGLIFPYGGIYTDKEWIIETDFDDPYFACDRETGQWFGHTADVVGDFLYRSFELTDADLPMEFTTYHPNIERPEKTSELLKGVLFQTPKKELKLSARFISLEEALKLLKGE